MSTTGIVGKSDFVLPIDANTNRIDPSDEIRRLRAKGLSITRIAQILNADEFLVARVCGVPLWKGRDPRTMQKDTW
jgi:hypothetical protein